MKMFITAILFMASIDATASGKWLERHHQEAWCGARADLVAIEYRLPDKTRVDCLLTDYALEVEWDYRWAESIGQSLYYALMTGRKPAVLLILGTNGDRYLRRLKLVAHEYGITVFTMDRVEVSQ